MTESKMQQTDEARQQDFKAIRRVLDGDTAAFSLLQKKYKRLIASLIRRMIKNEDDVDDLTQETFIKSYNALSTFQFGYSFSSWLFRIASNNCIDFLRKKRFQTISLSRPTDNSGEDREDFDIEDTTSKADSLILSNERQRILEEAIQSLPENFRKIIHLRHEEDMDYLEISKALDIPLGTVKAHLFRARKLLLYTLKKQKYLFF